MSTLDAFREVQHESTEKLSQHLLQLQRAAAEANDLHREQLRMLQQLILKGTAGSVDEVPSAVSKPRKMAESLAGSKANESPRTPPEISTRIEADKDLREGAGAKPEPAVTRSVEKASQHRIEFDLPLKVSHGWLVSWGIGYSGLYKVLDYNFDRLVAYGAIPYFFGKASIFLLRHALILQILVQPLVIAIVAAITRAGVDKESDIEYLKHSIEFCSNALQRLAPFLLGLFISLKLKRWWVLRANFLHKIHVCSAQLSMQLGMVVPASASRFKKRIEGYLLASHKMVYYCARHHHMDLDYDLLVDGDMLTKTELQHLLEATKHAPPILQGRIGACDMAMATLPVVWASQILYRLFLHAQANKNDFPIHMLVMMLSQCLEIKKSIHDIEMMLNTPLPLPYVHLVTLVVHALALFTCIDAGIYIGASRSIDTASCVTYTLGVMVLNGLYSGLLNLGSVLINPFLQECVDFPAANFQCRMRKSQIFSHDVYFDCAAIDAEIVRDHQAKNINAQKLDELFGERLDDDPLVGEI